MYILATSGFPPPQHWLQRTLSRSFSFRHVVSVIYNRSKHVGSQEVYGALGTASDMLEFCSGVKF